MVIGGAWVAAYSWRRRTGRAHAASFLMVLVGVGMLALEVLPRVGYAKTNPLQPATWACGGSSGR